MFLDNKYSKWYFNIINKSKTRTCPTSYTEKHHILPKSLGGSNKINNLVVLTGKEHFICHLLLINMTTGKHKSKMINAAWALANLKTINQKRYKINSKQYAILRENFAKTHSAYRTGRKHSEETKQKISAGNRGKVSPLKGKERSSAIKEKISKSTTGRIRSLAHQQNLAKSNKERPAMLGKQHTTEAKKKMSESRLNTPKINCIHCNRDIDPGNYKKYHGNRCKLFICGS